MQKRTFASVWVDGLFVNLFDMNINAKHWRILHEWYKYLLCKMWVGDHLSVSLQVLVGVFQWQLHFNPTKCTQMIFQKHAVLRASEDITWFEYWAGKIYKTSWCTPKCDIKRVEQPSMDCLIQVVLYMKSVLLVGVKCTGVLLFPLKCMEQNCHACQKMP
jgi:hypothetical protein